MWFYEKIFGNKGIVIDFSVKCKKLICREGGVNWSRKLEVLLNIVDIISQDNEWCFIWNWYNLVKYILAKK